MFWGFKWICGGGLVPPCRQGVVGRVERKRLMAFGEFFSEG